MLVGGDGLRSLQAPLVSLVVAATLIAAACSPKIDRTAILGRYVANHGKGLDAIELKQDGTYSYLYWPQGGAEFRNSGRWTFYYQNSEPRVTFRDFVFGLRDYSGTMPGYWDVGVEQSWLGKLRLPLDADLNYYYLQRGR